MLKKVDFAYIIDLLVMFLLVQYIDQKLSVFSVDRRFNLILMTTLWTMISIISSKFKLRKLYLAIIQIFFINALIFLIAGILDNYDIIHYPSIRFPLIMILITGFEIFIYVGKHYAIKFQRENSSFSETSLISEQESDVYDLSLNWFAPKDTNLRVPVKKNDQYSIPLSAHANESNAMLTLLERYLKNHQTLFQFICEMLSLKNISKEHSIVMDSDIYYNIEHLEENSYHLFINLHQINDFRRINHYLSQINKLLINGGVFICCSQTIDQRWNFFLKNYTKIWGIILYFFDFLFRRIFPKLPFLQGWYFMLTNGKDRAISETETIGRFYYNGFELIAKQDINDLMVYILKKSGNPKTDKNPTYGPMIKLTRIGKDRKTFSIYKLRTMHPYSEFLQDYVYQVSHLSNNGKFQNDFRITEWGHFFRTCWIDELPQLWNLLKGDVKLVGVRALSQHYFSLYPKELQDLRTKVKPGLIPPFYVDLPETFEQILNSEKRYLEKYLQHPLRTDFRYFCKAIWNILFKKARSR